MPENDENLFTADFEFEQLTLIDETEKQKETVDTTTEEVEDETATQTTNTDSNNQESSDDTSSSSSLSFLVTALGEELGIDVNQEELTKAENKMQFLRDAVSKWKEEEIKKELTDEQKEALDAIKNGVPLKEYVNTKATQKSYSALKEEDIKENKSLQEVLIRNRYITQGFTEDKANKMIADLKAISDERITEEALEAKTFMIEKEKEHEIKLKESAKVTNETKEKDRIASLEKVKTFVLAQKETIPGLELTEAFKEDVYKSMTTAIGKDDRGNLLNETQLKRSKNPIDYEYKLALYTKLGFFDEKPDFSKILKVAEKKTTKGLEKLLGEGMDFMPNGKSKTDREKDNDFGLDVFD